MSINVVNVVMSASTSPVDVATAEGYIIASPDGVQYPDASGDVIVPAVQQGTLVNGTCTISLVASDNYAPGVLTWDFIINIRGLPTVTASQVPVNYANGATQNIWTILSNNGWTP